MSLLTWDKLSWEALATLLTGMVAVGAALLVGLGQLAITRRQNRISERQAGLAELTLRQQLFDKRIGVYDPVAKFIGAIIRERTYPAHLEVEFFTALDRSKFLFSAQTHEGLVEISTRAQEFRIAKAAADQQATDPAVEDETIGWFLNRLETLFDLFGDELRLADPDTR